MQFEYKRPTDALHKIELPSDINQAIWDRPIASVGEEVGFRIYTKFVGNGSDIIIHICNRSGVWIDEIKGKVYGNSFKGIYTIPNKAKETIYFEVELKKHNLKCKSDLLKVIPPIKITNVRWSETEAGRGDIVKLTADIDGVPDGTEALIEIFEYDTDGAHDFISKFPVLVEHRMVEAEWEFEYYEDIDDIPTADESEKGYCPPKYFFQVKIGEIFGESDLLEFRDWIEIILQDHEGKPIAGVEDIFTYPDGEKKRQITPSNGIIRFENIQPGKYSIKADGYYITLE